MKILKPIVAALAVAVLAACSPTSARVGISPPPAMLVKVYEAPMTLRRNQGPDTGRGVVIPPNLVEGNSYFYGVSLNIPGLTGGGAASVGWGDGSTEAALKNGNLKEIIYADYKEVSIINGVFTYIKIKAYGERADAPASAK